MRAALNGKIKNRIGKRINATIENKIVAFVYVSCFFTLYAKSNVTSVEKFLLIEHTRFFS